MSNSVGTKLERALTWLVSGVGVFYVLMFAALAALRLVYPYEVEWNEGAVLDHAIRLFDHASPYSTPSLHFSAFIYTPLYYWVCAPLVALLGPGLPTLRLVSILSSLGQVAEGVTTTEVVNKLALENGVEMPLCAALHAILFEDKSATVVIEALLARPVKDE